MSSELKFEITRRILLLVPKEPETPQNMTLD